MRSGDLSAFVIVDGEKLSEYRTSTEGKTTTTYVVAEDGKYFKLKMNVDLSKFPETKVGEIDKSESEDEENTDDENDELGEDVKSKNDNLIGKIFPGYDIYIDGVYVQGRCLTGKRYHQNFENKTSACQKFKFTAPDATGKSILDSKIVNELSTIKLVFKRRRIAGWSYYKYETQNSEAKIEKSMLKDVSVTHLTKFDKPKGNKRTSWFTSTCLEVLHTFIFKYQSRSCLEVAKIVPRPYQPLDIGLEWDLSTIDLERKIKDDVVRDTIQRSAKRYLDEKDEREAAENEETKKRVKPSGYLETFNDEGKLCIDLTEEVSPYLPIVHSNTL